MFLDPASPHPLVDHAPEPHQSVKTATGLSVAALAADPVTLARKLKSKIFGVQTSDIHHLNGGELYILNMGLK